jgi:hypothetical protein
MQKRFFNGPPDIKTGTPKAVLQHLIISFYALKAGMVIFAAIFFGMNRLFTEPLIGDEKFFRFLFAGILFFSALLLTFAEKRYRKIISDAIQPELNLSLIEKLGRYRVALIFYLACCEGPALLSLIFYFFTNRELFLAVAGLLLVAMFLKKPDKARVIHVLHLSSEEQMEFQ